MSLPETGIEPLDNYCKSVQSGDRSVGEYVRKAVDRHYSDLERWGVNHYDKENEEFEREPEGKYYFDPAAARHYVSFFEDNLQHYDGVFAGQPFIFEPWQWFAFGSPFGWLKVKRINDMAVRRFSSMDVFVPKKQGKSAWIGGNMLFFLKWDNYPGAQIYSLAINQSHAKELGYRDAEIMADNSPTLDYKIKKGAAFMGIYYEENNAHIKPLVSDEQIADGPKIHLAANDEIKDWKNKELYETLVNGTASDPMAMIINISTAGSDKQSLGYERHQYVEKLLDGVIEDETSFAVVYGIDEEDKEEDNYWQNIELYKKANPNFGVTVGEDYYVQRINSAVGSPSKISSLKCKHLNEWVSSMDGFIVHEEFTKCAKSEVTLPMLAERRCIAALDLGEVIDLTAFAIIGVPEYSDEDYLVKLWRWLPDKSLEDRKNASQLKEFIQDGFIRTTKGNATDFDIVEQDIIDIIEQGLGVEQIIFDPNKGQQIPQHLSMRGIEPIAMAQTFRNLNPGVDEMEQAILSERMNYGDDEMLSWSNSNIVIAENRDEYRKFDKREAQDKIDDMVALEMAFAHAASSEEDKQEKWDSEFVAI